MLDYVIDSKRSIYKKTQENYNTDSVFDIIDVSECLSKASNIPRINEEKFIFAKDPNKQNVISQKEKLINNSHNINVFDVFKDLSSESRFGKSYEIIDFIGEGSFGVVISALDKNLKQKIAIKIIPKYKFSRNVHEYLEREVTIQSGVSNQHIIKLFGVCETKDYLCLAMELCEGGSLKDFLIRRYYAKNSEFLSEEECSSIIKRILKALDYMYSLNIMHRDIKPENIMFSSKNDIKSLKIGDFGLSIYTERMEQSKCGTLIYNSPEQINEHAYDQSVDLWACGFILYILCSGGKHPFYDKRKMCSEKYVQAIKNFKEYTFPDSFPLLARNLFLKLCKFNKIYRYETHRALNHPWITRKTCQIPLTIIEAYDKKDLVKKFKNMLRASMFFYTYKAVYNYLFLVKKKKNVTNPNLKSISKKNQDSGYSDFSPIKIRSFQKPVPKRGKSNINVNHNGNFSNNDYEINAENLHFYSKQSLPLPKIREKILPNTEKYFQQKKYECSVERKDYSKDRTRYTTDKERRGFVENSKERKPSTIGVNKANTGSSLNLNTNTNYPIMRKNTSIKGEINVQLNFDLNKLNSPRLGNSESRKTPTINRKNSRNKTISGTTGINFELSTNKLAKRNSLKEAIKAVTPLKDRR